MKASCHLWEGCIAVAFSKRTRAEEGEEGVGNFCRYGPGCVLVQETVRTLPRGSASGFSYHARPSSQDTDEPPPYTSQEWIAEYVPRSFLLNPSLALDVHSPPTDASDNSVPPSVIDAIAQVELAISPICQNAVS